MKRIICLLFVLFGFHSTAFGIVIRHDISDELYRNLGEEYTLSVAYVSGCAATVIDTGWLLTAAHCVEGKENSIYTALHVDQKYRVNNIFIHPEFSRENDELFDVALVELKDQISTSKPARLYKEIDEKGQRVVFVGRGTFGNGSDGLIKDDFVQRGATNTIISADDYVIGFVFDSPENSTELEGVSSRGDSGGPAFIFIGDDIYVAGVSSYQVGNGFREGRYGVSEYYTRVSSVSPWIEATMAEAPKVEVATHPIIDAVKSNSSSALQLALTREDIGDEVIEEAFYQSIILDRVELAEVLIIAGFDYQSLVFEGDTIFSFALKENKLAYYEMLQSKTVATSYRHPASSRVLPLYVSKNIESDVVASGIQELILQGAYIDATNSFNETALIIAGWKSNDLDLIRLLVESGADVNAMNGNGDTPTIDAAYLGKGEILRYLLDNGGNPAMANNQGKTALDFARENNDETAISLLTRAAFN